MFSLASIATMTACIFLFGLFFSIVINFRYIVQSVEQNVGVTVMFDDGLDQASIDAIGTQIENLQGVTGVKYISADEAWEEFSQYYFSSLDDEEMYKEGFSNDNPLAQSSSYTVYVDNIENQDRIVQEIEAMDGVRTVNQLQGATTTLSTFNRLVS